VPTLCSARLCGPLWVRASARRHALPHPGGGLRRRADITVTRATPIAAAAVAAVAAAAVAVAAAAVATSTIAGCSAHQQHR
jgi:hypothetical protein